MAIYQGILTDEGGHRHPILTECSWGLLHILVAKTVVLKLPVKQVFSIYLIYFYLENNDWIYLHNFLLKKEKKLNPYINFGF